MVGCRILLADDDPAVHRMVQRVATEFGHELIPVRKGVAVLAMALESKPDLIVLDIGFPDADGRDVLAQLKAEPRTAEIPVLVWKSGSGAQVYPAFGTSFCVSRVVPSALLSEYLAS